jgi:hypothetical protein
MDEEAQYRKNYSKGIRSMSKRCAVCQKINGHHTPIEANACKKALKGTTFVKPMTQDEINNSKQMKV